MIEITYLLNSGFLVRVGRTLLVFDDFKDPAGAVDAAVEAADFDHLYFFASHGHFDHFDAHICAYEAKTERYILSDDIRCTKALSSFDQAKLVFLKTYASWQDEHIAVASFDSTDIGTSFRAVLKDEGVTLFHAGDFNWCLLPRRRPPGPEHRQGRKGVLRRDGGARARHDALRRLSSLAAARGLFRSRPFHSRLVAAHAGREGLPQRWPIPRRLTVDY